METNQLKSFVHIAELGSLSKVADRLKIAQPALSRQMRLLEAELGVPLFNRHGRGMALTEIGERVLADAAGVLASMDRIRATASAGQTNLNGKVIIGMPPTIAEFATVPLVRLLRERFPDLQLQIASAFSGHILEWLKRGEIDLSISYDPQLQRSLHIKPIMIETLHFLRKGPSMKADERVAFADLARQDLVLPSKRHGLRILLDDLAAKVGVSLEPSIEAESLTAMLDLVRAGFGGTVLPLASLHQSELNQCLSSACIVDPTPSRRVVIAYPIDRKVSLATRAVGAAFEEIAQQLIKEKFWSGQLINDTL